MTEVNAATVGPSHRLQCTAVDEVSARPLRRPRGVTQQAKATGDGTVPAAERGEASRALLGRVRYLTPGEASDDGRVVVRESDGRAEEFYRDRWRHDREVRSTHGVNCTGSCSWMIYVRDGIVSWETQATDYPETSPDMPDVEPRGCPRGATFSWYTYQPGRVRYPYVRGALLEMWREARRENADPVDAWASIATDAAEERRLQRRAGPWRLHARDLGRGARALRRGARRHHRALGARPRRRRQPDSRHVARSRTPRARATWRSPAARRTPSTIGTPTCRRPRRRSSATRPTCPNRRTGGMPPTS